MTNITLEQAVRLIEQNTTPITGSSPVPLSRSLRRRSATDIMAPIDLPPFDRSPLDGYALRSADSSSASLQSPVELKVIGEIYAGDVFRGEVGAGQAVRIMTGAMIPAGCDCVIRQEDTDSGEETVRITAQLKCHQNFVFRREDIHKGQLLISRGERLSYVHLGVLASMGFEFVEVFDNPRVGLLCTGDELTAPGEPLLPGKIYNGNGYLIAARLEDLDIPVINLPAAADNPGAMAAQLDAAMGGLDVLITTGGVSVGKRDVMHEVFELLDVRRIFWGVSIKPGAPALCGIYKGKMLLCLSGNPFAAITTLELLGRPLLATLTGRKDLGCFARKQSILQSAFPKKSKGRRFIRAYYGPDGVYLPQGHSSGQLFSMVNCNCLVDIPAGSPPLDQGDIIEIVML